MHCRLRNVPEAQEHGQQATASRPPRNLASAYETTAADETVSSSRHNDLKQKLHLIKFPEDHSAPDLLTIYPSRSCLIKKQPSEWEFGE